MKYALIGDIVGGREDVLIDDDFSSYRKVTAYAKNVFPHVWKNLRVYRYIKTIKQREGGDK
jgi:hypothetical protein